MATTRTFALNGKSVTATVDDPRRALPYILRNDAGLPRARVLAVGWASVVLHGSREREGSAFLHAPLSSINARDGSSLSRVGDESRPQNWQTAFIEEQQCMRLLHNGMIMYRPCAVETNPKPSVPEIKRTRRTNLCRCGHSI